MMATEREDMDDLGHLRQRSARNPPVPRVTPAASGAGDDPADAWGAARWRRESGKVAVFILVVGLLEVTNWYLLATAFAWVLPGTVLPGLAALAVIVVLIGTVFSGSLLSNPVLRSHRLRLTITLFMLLALQATINAVEGFGVARTHLPPAVGEFFHFGPLTTARLVGAVMGGGLALITFSCLLFVAQILEEMLPPPDLERDAELFLRRYERGGRRASAGIGARPPDGADPTVQMPSPDHGSSQTMPATRFWGFMQHPRREPE